MFFNLNLNIRSNYSDVGRLVAHLREETCRVRARRCDLWGRQCDWLYSVATKFSCLVANLAPKIGDFLLCENVHQ